MADEGHLAALRDEIEGLIAEKSELEAELDRRRHIDGVELVTLLMRGAEPTWVLKTRLNRIRRWLSRRIRNLQREEARAWRQPRHSALSADAAHFEPGGGGGGGDGSEDEMLIPPPSRAPPASYDSDADDDVLFPPFVPGGRPPPPSVLFPPPPPPSRARELLPGFLQPPEGYDSDADFGAPPPPHPPGARQSTLSAEAAPFKPGGGGGAGRPRFHSREWVGRGRKGFDEPLRGSTRPW